MALPPGVLFLGAVATSAKGGVAVMHSSRCCCTKPMMCGDRCNKQKLLHLIFAVVPQCWQQLAHGPWQCCQRPMWLLAARQYRQCRLYRQRTQRGRVWSTAWGARGKQPGRSAAVASPYVPRFVAAASAGCGQLAQLPGSRSRATSAG